MESLIAVRDLHYKYEDGTVALDGVNFDLFPGETVALLGANGSGKTTFVLHLNGLLAGRGQVIISGVSIARKSLPIIRRKVGIVFQDVDDQLFMPTVLEDVAFGLLNRGVAPERARELSLEALAAVGMNRVADRAPYHLSAGEKRKVAIAGVLAMEPDVLVLDEPTTSLDPPSQRELITLLRQLSQAKLIVTHDTQFAAEIATRAVFFQKGRIAADGTVDQIKQQFGW